MSGVTDPGHRRRPGPRRARTAPAAPTLPGFSREKPGFHPRTVRVFIPGLGDGGRIPRRPLGSVTELADSESDGTGHGPRSQERLGGAPAASPARAGPAHWQPEAQAARAPSASARKPEGGQVPFATVAGSQWFLTASESLEVGHWRQLHDSDSDHASRREPGLASRTPTRPSPTSRRCRRS
jgi:hypothetical protein